MNLDLKSKIRKGLGFSKTSIYWTSKGAGKGYFTKQVLVNAMPFLVNKWLNKILVYQ